MRHHNGSSHARWHKHWQDFSLAAKIGIIAAGVVAAGGIFLLFGYIVVWLWNWLMPGIFKLPTIGFWQAWGLLVLSTILFKGHASADQRKHDRRRKRDLRERLHNMGDVDEESGSQQSDKPDAGPEGVL